MSYKIYLEDNKKITFKRQDEVINYLIDLYKTDKDKLNKIKMQNYIYVYEFDGYAVIAYNTGFDKNGNKLHIIALLDYFIEDKIKVVKIEKNKQSWNMRETALRLIFKEFKNELEMELEMLGFYNDRPKFNKLYNNDGLHIVLKEYIRYISR